MNNSDQDLINSLDSLVEWDFFGEPRESTTMKTVKTIRMGKPRDGFWNFWQEHKVVLINKGYGVKQAPVYGWVVEHVQRSKRTAVQNKLTYTAQDFINIKNKHKG